MPYDGGPPLPQAARGARGETFAARARTFMEPGRPVVWRRYSFCDALLPVTVTFSALITTTYPPMSTDGE